MPATDAKDTTDAGQDSAARASGRSPTTQWSVVLQAADTHDSQQALERLCRMYWYPLYAFAQRSGASPVEAQDLTQGFFEQLLRGHLVGKAEIFKDLSPLLQGERAEGGYAYLAKKLGVVEGTLKWTVSQMRARYRALICSVIAETVATRAEVEEEVHHLIAVLRH